MQTITGNKSNNPIESQFIFGRKFFVFLKQTKKILVKRSFERLLKIVSKRTFFSFSLKIIYLLLLLQEYLKVQDLLKVEIKQLPFFFKKKKGKYFKNKFIKNKKIKNG